MNHHRIFTGALYVALLVTLCFTVHLSQRVRHLEDEASARSLMARRIPVQLRP